MESRLLMVTIPPKPRKKLISWPTSQVMIGDETFEETGAEDQGTDS